MDLQASGAVGTEVDGFAIITRLREQYAALWAELTDEEEFSASEMWRIESRIERLNDLGFDVDELDIVTDFDGDQVRIQPKVVELGHHCRELQTLTGMNVEDAQARRLLNDLAAYTAHFDLGREDKHLVANKWLTEIYEPIMPMIPPDARGKLEPAEVFHEILVHRWYLSEQSRPGGRHLRHRPRLHRHRARHQARRADHRGRGTAAADDLGQHGTSVTTKSSSIRSRKTLLRALLGRRPVGPHRAAVGRVAELLGQRVGVARGDAGVDVDVRLRRRSSLATCSSAASRSARPPTARPGSRRRSARPDARSPRGWRCRSCGGGSGRPGRPR